MTADAYLCNILKHFHVFCRGPGIVIRNKEDIRMLTDNLCCYLVSMNRLNLTNLSMQVNRYKRKKSERVVHKRYS